MEQDVICMDQMHQHDRSIARTRRCAFHSDGVRLEGLLQLPRDAGPGPRPAIVLCSGFQGLKEIIPSRLWPSFVAAGYACLAFDYRGFGDSAGERGRVVPAEQVEDVRSAVAFLEQRHEIDPSRIGLVGWGLGGGVAVQAAAEDARVAAVACLNGVGDAGRAVRASRPGADWVAMLDRIGADRRRRALTGRSELVSPWEVVPLDPVVRSGVDEHMYARHPRFGERVSLRSAEAYYAFRPELAAARVSPRPLLVVHGSRNTLHPVEEALSLLAHAREPKELIELPDGQHLDWIQPEHALFATTMPRIVAWFDRHLGAGEEAESDACVPGAGRSQAG
jgi:pimeloyl-ACP methyl ester carboxylesterase